MNEERAQEVEWLRQNNLSYVGLMGVSIVMVQPFLTADSMELPATISVVSFAAAIPLLAGLLMLNWQETHRRRYSRSWLVSAVKAIAQLLAFIGIAAGFWTIWWIAGLVFALAAFVAMMVHSTGFVRLERDAGELAKYLPEPLSDDDLRMLVDEAIAESGAESPRDMGKVVKLLTARVAGRADGKTVAAAVKDRLTG